MQKWGLFNHNVITQLIGAKPDNLFVRDIAGAILGLLMLGSTMLFANEADKLSYSKVRISMFSDLSCSIVFVCAVLS